MIDAAEGSKPRGRTGPRSAEGKERSSRNALRHGLAVPISMDLAFSADVSRLARLFMGRDTQLDDAAIRAAEAQLEIERIRRVRASALQEFEADDRPSEGVDLAGLSAFLASLDRYERRAFSRRKRALRELICVQS